MQVLFDFAIVGFAVYFGIKLWRIWDQGTVDYTHYENDRKSLTIFGNEPFFLRGTSLANISGYFTYIVDLYALCLCEMSNEFWQGIEEVSYGTP
jgi:hypothetical protein